MSSAPTTATADESALTAPDVEVLKWALLHRSELNPLALNRLVEKYRGRADELNRGRADELTIDARVVRGQAFRLRVTLQFMVELTLAEPQVQEWRERWHQQDMTLYDALYYVSNRWQRQGEPDGRTLDVGKGGRKAFEKYLHGRANVREAITLEEGDPKPGVIPQPKWTEQQLEFLYGLTGSIAERLTWDEFHRVSLKEHWMEIGGPWTDKRQWILDALLLQDPPRKHALLKRREDAPSVLEWQYDPTGQLWVEAQRGLEGPPTPSASHLYGTPEAAMLNIARVDALLSPLMVVATTQVPGDAYLAPYAAARAFGAGTAGTAGEAQVPGDAYEAARGLRGGALEALARWSVLPSTPAWSQVRRALRNIVEEHTSGASGMSRSEDFAVVREFDSFLRDPMLARAVHMLLVEAAALGGFAAEATEPLAAAIVRGAPLLAEGCGFARSDIRGVEAQLGLMLARLRALLPGLAQLGARLAPAQADADAGAEGDVWPPLETLEREAKAALDEGHIARSDGAAAIEAGAWTSLRARLQQQAWVRAETQADADELLCAAAGTGPAPWVTPSLSRMTLRGWTRCLTHGATEPGRQWLARAALEFLGMANMDAEWQQAMHDSLPAAGSEEAGGEPIGWSAVGRGNRAVLVVARAEGSCTERWTDPGQHALVLVCEAADAERVVSVLPAKPPGTVHLVLESVAATAAQEQALQRSLSKRMGNNVMVSYLFRAGEAANRQPFVIEPNRPDDLVGAPS